MDGEGKRHAGGQSGGGGYAVPDLPPGGCDVTIVADGYAEWHERVDLAPGAAVVRRDVVLQPLLRIPVRFVTPQGGSLWMESQSSRGASSLVSGPPLTIVPTKEPLAAGTPGWSVRRETRFGRFQCERSLTGECDGTLELRGELPLIANLVMERRVLESRPITAPVDGLEFVVDPATLVQGLATVRWRVADAVTGSPLDLSAVYIGGPLGETGSDAKQFCRSDGSYEIPSLDPGEVSLSFEAAGHERLRSRMLIAPGDDHDLGTILLAPAATIAGRVLDPDGNPIRARITANVFDRTLPPPFIGRERYIASGEASGEFTIAAGRRRVLLFVKAAGCAWESHVVDASAGDVRDLEFRLVSGTRVAIRVAAERWRLLSIEVRTDSGQPIGTASIAGSETAHLALRPGNYRVVVLEDGAERAAHDLVVGETAVSLEITPSAS